MKKYQYKIFLILSALFFLSGLPAASYSKTDASDNSLQDDSVQADRSESDSTKTDSTDTSTDSQPESKETSDKPVTNKPKSKPKHKHKTNPKTKPVISNAPQPKKFIVTKPIRPETSPPTSRQPVKISQAPKPSDKFSPRLVTKDPAIKTRTVQVTRGQNFDQIMQKLGFDEWQIDELTSRLARETEFVAAHANLGQKIILTEKIEDNKRKLLAMEIPTDRYIIHISKSRAGTIQISKEINRNSPTLSTSSYFYKQGTVKSTLNGLTSSLKIPSSITSWVNRIISSKLNIAKISKNDKLELLYAYTYNNAGKQIGTKLLYLNLNSRSGKIEAYRYSPDKEDSPDFYDINGNSFSKSMLSSPLRGKHKITSGFGYRDHPIFGHRMLHSGVDFSTKVGTPVYAAGDGTIDKIGRFGGYGNYIRVKHDGIWSTAYAHLSSFVRGVSQWKKVKKGTLIAYTGNSGRSTGPHLHFELLQNGNPVDPLKAKLPVGGRKLIGSDLYNFRQEARRINNIIVQQKDLK